MSSKLEPNKRTVLITGCSDGGLGAALAAAFHEAGLHVYASARNPSKMKEMAALGIETLTLDVTSSSSIAAAVAAIPHLDILVNNAGASYSNLIADVDLKKAKETFDLNVWSYIEMTQAFLPKLVESKGLIVNNTSVASVSILPFQSVYHASKAAIAVFSDTQRLELAPFGVRIVDLKTGSVGSQIQANLHKRGEGWLPEGSIYNVSADANKACADAMLDPGEAKEAMDRGTWAREVVAELVKEKPRYMIWKGAHALLGWMAWSLPHGLLDGTIEKLSKFDVVKRELLKVQAKK